jgi:hypothetical protein
VLGLYADTSTELMTVFVKLPHEKIERFCEIVTHDVLLEEIFHRRDPTGPGDDMI